MKRVLRFLCGVGAGGTSATSGDARGDDEGSGGSEVGDRAPVQSPEHTPSALLALPDLPLARVLHALAEGGAHGGDAALGARSLCAAAATCRRLCTLAAGAGGTQLSPYETAAMGFLLSTGRNGKGSAFDGGDDAGHTASDSESESESDGEGGSAEASQRVHALLCACPRSVQQARRSRRAMAAALAVLDADGFQSTPWTGVLRELASFATPRAQAPGMMMWDFRGGNVEPGRSRRCAAMQHRPALNEGASSHVYSTAARYRAMMLVMPGVSHMALVCKISGGFPSAGLILSLRHLSSFAQGPPGDGRSHVTISVSGGVSSAVVYGPARAPASHNWLEESVHISADTLEAVGFVRGERGPRKLRVTISLAPEASTHYWIQGACLHHPGYTFAGVEACLEGRDV